MNWLKPGSDWIGSILMVIVFEECRLGSLISTTDLNDWSLRTGKLSRQNDFDLIREGLNKLSKAQIHIDDQPGNTILKMRSVARRLKSEGGLDLIIVDYLQLIVPAQTKSDNLVQ